MDTKLKRICIVSPDYPSEERPYVYTFVDQLACAIADQGINVSVITPHDVIKTKKRKDEVWERRTEKGHIIKVYSPAAPILSTRKIGFVNINRISIHFFMKAVDRIIKNMDEKPDLVYSHFLSPAGITASYIGKKYKIPSMCAFGESSLWSIRELGLNAARERLKDISGIVAVSTHNKNVLIENNLISENKIRVIPNAVNQNEFFPRDKIFARKKYNLPENMILGIYTGTFSYSKGSLRVQKAACRIPDLKMLYIGNGSEMPEGDNIAFRGRVAHEEIPWLLSAADFFVLPTLEEGCCNAIIEAMACGLPVITSDLPFNYDILDSESAILLDPLDGELLHQAMKKISEDEQLRNQLSMMSLKRAEPLNISKRAEVIIDYMKELLVENQNKKL